MGIFSTIIKDAIGYYLNKPLTVTDNLSSALSGKTPVAGTTDGEVAGTSGKATWTLGQQDPLLTAGTLYTSTFTVDLNSDDNVYSGAMPTNADVTVKSGDTVLNSIPESNSPILKKSVTLILKEYFLSWAQLEASSRKLPPEGS